MQTITPVRRIATIEQAAQILPFTPAALRDLKFSSRDRFNSRGDRITGNGSAAAGVWLQVGRKVLVDIDAFENWLDSHKAA